MNDNKRTPYDGKPYYCESCGLSFAELQACEDGGCELESAQAARDRKREHDQDAASAEWEKAREYVEKTIDQEIASMSDESAMTPLAIRQFIALQMIEDLTGVDRKAGKNFIKACLKICDPNCDEINLHLSHGAMMAATKKLKRADERTAKKDD